MDAAISVHTELGPGLLESLYEQALAYELTLRGLVFERLARLPVQYKGKLLEADFRLDFIVEKLVIIELKAVKAIEPIHEAQLLTYLRLSRVWLGLLLNFNVRHMREGIKRIVY